MARPRRLRARGFCRKCPGIRLGLDKNLGYVPSVPSFLPSFLPERFGEQVSQKSDLIIFGHALDKVPHLHFVNLQLYG